MLLVSFWVPMSNLKTNTELVIRNPIEVIVSYEEHPFIHIYNDSQFAAQASAESWPGAGTEEEPYLIQGYNISETEELIRIENTTVYFEITDCWFNFSLFSIYLLDVSNAVIQNCIMKETWEGVHIENCTDVIVSGCDIEPDLFGVYMDETIDCRVENTIIRGSINSESGIFSIFSEGLVLFNNTIFEFDQHGILLAFGGFAEILNNTLYDNEGTAIPNCGIYLAECFMIEVSGNNLTQNADSGISVSHSPNVTIIENLIIDSWYHGVYVLWSDNCTIKDNYISGSGDGLLGGMIGCGINIDQSDYCQILGNEFWWNAINSIALFSSDWCYIYNNYINHSFDCGITLTSSHNCTMLENEIYNAYGYGGGPSCGIVTDLCDDTSIIGNVLGSNADNGITVYNSDKGEISGNTVYDSIYSGIWLDVCSNWTITSNIIYDNGAPGIFLAPSNTYILLYLNDVGWSGEYLVHDDGQWNDWNSTGVGNWYSDYTGTGTYTIPGEPTFVDHHPSVSLYCGATDPLEYEAGTTGNTMNWNSSALNPWKYEVLVDNELHSTVEWDGAEINANVDGVPVGVHNVTLVVYHVSGHWLSNASTLTVVDTQAPTWDVTPEDQYLEFGAALSYDIDASDPSGLDAWWLSGDPGFVIDSLGVVTNATTLVVGIYSLTVHVNDTYGQSVSAGFDVYVTDTIYPVWVTTPVDQEINEDEAFSYQLAATDLGGIGGWIVNDTTHFAISSSGLITNATVLAPDDYGLNISVWDNHGNVRSHTIRVRVIAVTPPPTTTTTSPTTTTEPPTNTTSPPPGDITTMIVIAVGGAGAVIVIVIVLIASKKKAG
jgi:parallel beta-helix repeat protein